MKESARTKIGIYWRKR